LGQFSAQRETLRWKVEHRNYYLRCVVVAYFVKRHYSKA
jgi:hypothetical protein